MIRHRLVRRLLGLLVTDLIEETSRRLDEAGCASPDDVRSLPENIVALPPETEAMTRELKHFLYENLYYHPRVVRMQTKAERVLEALFEAYVAEPKQLPREVQAQIEAGDRSFHRVICDYIAGMTDRYALQEYAKLFDPNVKV